MLDAQDWDILSLCVFTGICLALTVYILRYYTSRNWARIHLVIHGLLFVSYFTCFFPVAMLLVDVDSALTSWTPAATTDSTPTEEATVTHGKPYLTLIWQILFAMTNLLSWIVVPVCQSYCEVGQFTTGKKILASIALNFKLYIAVGVVCGGLLVWIAVAKRVHDFGSVVAVGIAASNSFGLLVTMLLLGYGLVELPRHFWMVSNIKRLLVRYQFKAALLSEENDKAKLHWKDDIIALVSKVNLQLPETDQLRPHFNHIMDLIMQFEKSVADADSRWLSSAEAQFRKETTTRRESGDEVSYKALVELHARVRKAIFDLQRTEFQWRQHQEAYFDLEAVCAAKEDLAAQNVATAFRPARSGACGGLLDKLSHLYWFKFRTPLLRLSGFLLAALSGLVLYSELVVPINPKLSVIYHLVVPLKGRPYAIQAVMLTFVVYIAWTIYWSLFRFKLFDQYQLVPHHTHPSSLCFTAYMMCRLMMPVCFNFLQISNLLLPDDQVANSDISFTQAFGNMDLKSLLGEWFSKWAMGVVLLIMSMATLLNLYSRLLRMGGFTTFIQADISDDQVQEGARILRREKDRLTQLQKRTHADDLLDHGNTALDHL
eukprot:TRINITY_DN78153_c0_g1_i1.p1 TRINITY_DN78153_c0_g1~~TRINITY_DN78153_c0_g1_i1.p1  ORF type:complete len:609 (+),score=26.92 TRINITY_DN78153_c0_g1_i1:26-1828(+)